MGIASLVLGIIAVLIGLVSAGSLGWLGAILGIIGIILGALGRKDPDKQGINGWFSPFDYRFGSFLLLYIACGMSRWFIGYVNITNKGLGKISVRTEIFL